MILGIDVKRETETRRALTTENRAEVEIFLRILSITRECYRGVKTRVELPDVIALAKKSYMSKRYYVQS
jgi:hypothetical protein